MCVWETQGLLLGKTKIRTPTLAYKHDWSLQIAVKDIYHQFPPIYHQLAQL